MSRDDSDNRPNPDALLAQLQQQEAKAQRGRLKVFFGMAAGVGKTYAMLEEGRARAAEGDNVLVGYAEPHIRPETEALLLGMEILRYRMVEYRGAQLKEFDLDGALQRKPALLLIDELAHTNPPGMRHAKRWQDVVECLEAGIDVYTTLNVQHLESVNDIVERITGVTVRETLPDSVLERADEIELVDTTPEELLERLGEGKVYVGQQAEHALRNFFSRGNLLALRELALRKAAEQVDTQMGEFRRMHSVRSAWPASERLLVCVSPSPLSARLVRATRRLAIGLRAEWVAASVETPASSAQPADRERLARHLQLAEQLGGRTVTLSGQSVADELLAYAATHNITRIVVGKPDRPRWRELLGGGSIVDQLVRGSGDIDIYVIRGQAEETQPRPPAPRQPTSWPAYGWAAFVVGLSSAVGWLLHHHLGLANTNVLMFYLLGVLWVATRLGRGPAILASVLGVAAFDLLFVPPYYTFTVEDQEYLVTFAVMLLTAVVISTLTDRAHRQAESARQRERHTAALLALTRGLTAAREKEAILQTAVRHVASALDCPAIALLPDDHGGLRLIAHSAGGAIDEKERGVAQWAFQHDQPAGVGTGTLPAAQGFYLPMLTARGAIGVLGVTPVRPRQLDGPDACHLLEAFASQTAVAVERAALAEEARKAWERVETEFLRNTLLSSVSHDLRTPLAGVVGAASSLLDAGQNMNGAVRRELLETIRDEAERMDGLVNNLLDMTRLESGGLHLKKDWHPIEEVIGSALRHVDRRLRGRPVTVRVPRDLPLALLDGSAIEQVLVNLLENASQHTPPGSAVDMTARADGKHLVVEVADRGPGLPPGAENRLFQRFFHAPTQPGRRGIGLGLAIAKGIAEAHGGTIHAANREGGGAVFSISLPLGENPPTVDNAG